MNYSGLKFRLNVWMFRMKSCSPEEPGLMQTLTIKRPSNWQICSRKILNNLRKVPARKLYKLDQTCPEFFITLPALRRVYAGVLPSWKKHNSFCYSSPKTKKCCSRKKSKTVSFQLEKKIILQVFNLSTADKLWWNYWLIHIQNNADHIIREW